LRVKSNKYHTFGRGKKVTLIGQGFMIVQQWKAAIKLIKCEVSTIMTQLRCNIGTFLFLPMLHSPTGNFNDT
jgi:hypothetical protein